MHGRLNLSTNLEYTFNGLHVRPFLLWHVQLLVICANSSICPQLILVVATGSCRPDPPVGQAVEI